MTRPIDEPHKQTPPRSPVHPDDDAMPPYTPGGVPKPEGPQPKSPPEKTPPAPSYPPKQAP